MDKVYKHTKVEDKIYKRWEESGSFKPEVNPKGKPFSIILPPPNANGALHFGHAMYTVEDILIRYHRMKGDRTLWLPGTDHAGIETQFVFEKKLKEDGKSRLDFDRETLYKMIEEYVNENRGGIERQLRRLGFSLDWSRQKYTLDPDIVRIVYKTFKKMFDDSLIYRDYRLVNYCTFDGTSFSDLEVIYEEKKSPLYYIKYGPLTLATTRPETKFGDSAVAVNPKDERYKKYIGKEIEIETVIGKAKIKVIGDEFVDPAFGTGVVKITPAHDFDDFEVSKRHGLPLVQVINYDGKLNGKAGKFSGLYIKQARAEVVEEMKRKGILEKIDENYINRTPVCYKCKNPIEPLPLEQWFVKVESLKKEAIKAVKDRKIKLNPKNFETVFFQWLEALNDWNISRQIVWGMRIPAWKCENEHWTVTEGQTPKKCAKCNSKSLIQDTDTFDTWFSSGQWPFATLRASQSVDFETFYPTSIMETAYDILKAWVSRMVMLGIYIAGEIPFKNVLFHGLVKDPYGKKMSKSKGNVVDPLELVEEYGADSVRFALIYGNATGNDQALSYGKLQAARNFSNKLWNIGRFFDFHVNSGNFDNTPFLNDEQRENLSKEDLEMINKVDDLIKKVNNSIDNFRFNDAASDLYEFTWHVLADKYLEGSKERLNNGDKITFAAFRHVWIMTLKLLHPFMPFITEELWSKIPRLYEKDLIVSKWPEV